VPYREFAESEARFSMLWHTHPETAERLLALAQHDVRERYHRYQQLASLAWDEPAPE
jgi:pyruvate-ferredoxin/flavodoxin oxidoreductase